MAQTIAQNLFAVVIVLGFLIFAHESGHFFVAKFFGVRVLVYSFGFGKRLFGFQYGDTDYRVSLIPLGGYVRMAGDASEENPTGAPDEFLSKPKWQRFLILFAGPVMNVIVAVTFVAGLAMIGAEQVITQPVIGAVYKGQPADQAGLATGDRIVSIKGEPVADFDDVRLFVSMNAGTPVEVVYVRKGETRRTVLTPAREDGDFGPIGRAGITNGLEPLVGRVEPNSPAAVAGVRGGDRIVSVEGKPVAALEDYGLASEARAGKPVTIEVTRGTERVKVTIPASANEDMAISRGIVPPTTMLKLSLLPALKYSVKENMKMLKFTFSALGRLVRREGSVKELSGPVNIARISGEMFRRGFRNVIGLMAMISLQLGIMNLLPIPVLDGGHIMILLVEGVARRDLSIKVKDKIQQVGFFALAALMLVVVYNDVIGNVLRMIKG